jgi:hypothetical protein
MAVVSMRRWPAVAGVLAVLLAAVGVRAAGERPAVVVYSFHGTLRCTTCLMVEQGAEEAIRANFPGELGDGSLAWASVNIRLPEHRHFAEEYQVGSWALVLVEYRGETAGRWRTLARAGELVHADPAGYRRYVSAEVRAFLDGAPAATGESR